jgi:hypothetical protein
MRDRGQLCTGLGRFEMRNTLRPGVSTLCGGLQRGFSSIGNVESWCGGLSNEVDRLEGVPPRPYILDRGALHVDMIITGA